MVQILVWPLEQVRCLWEASPLCTSVSSPWKLEINLELEGEKDFKEAWENARDNEDVCQLCWQQ